MIESYEIETNQLSFCEFIELCNELNDIDELDLYGETLLLAACGLKRIDAIEYLLSKNANPNFLDDCGYTPLLVVIDSATDDEALSLKIAKVLVQSGAGLEVRGYMDKTPYLKVCSRNSLSMIKLLVEHGCDTKATVKDYGESFDGLYFAGVHGLLPEIIKYLKNTKIS